MGRLGVGICRARSEARLGRALRIDPRSMLYRDHIAFTYATIGDTAQALRIRQEVLAGLSPDGSQALQLQAELEVIENHDYERALEIR